VAPSVGTILGIPGRWRRGKNMKLILILSLLSCLSYGSTDVTTIENTEPEPTAVATATATTEGSIRHTQTTAHNDAVSRVIPQASVLFSNFVGSDARYFNTSSGYSAGLGMDLGRGQFVLESGLLYRKLGAQLSTDFGNLNITLQYLTIPLLAKLYFDDPSESGLYAKAGLLGGALVGKNADINQFGLSASTSAIPIRTFDLEMAVGFGGKLRFSNSNDLILELLYSRGVTTIDDSPNPMTIYNSVIMLTAGLGFDL
jgi:hypothetical protein